MYLLYLREDIMKNILYLFLALASFGLSAQTKTTAEEYLNSAISKLYLENIKGAIADFTMAIKIDSNYAPAYRDRGIVKGKLKDYSGVVEDYTRAIEIDPNYASAYFNRGVSKFYLGDLTGACKDARKAQALGDDASILIKKACN